MGLTLVNVKHAQIGLQKKSLKWRNQGKGSKGGKKICIESGMRHWKLKTLMKIRFLSKVIMVEETLEFKQTILLCYGRHKTLMLQQKIPKAQVWAIVKVVTHCLNLVVTTWCSPKLLDRLKCEFKAKITDE